MQSSSRSRAWARITLRTAVPLLCAGGLAATVNVSAAAAPSPASPCAAVHVIAARGSTELPGPGVIGSLVEKIQDTVTATVSTSAVAYPALLKPYDYSTTAGDTAVEQELTAETQRCPDQKIVLVGYSQGAQIIGDALAGGGGAAGLGPATAPVPQSVAGHVTAVVQYGDPRHMPNLTFDKGTDHGATGLFPRGADQSLTPFARIIQSYCDIGDPFCARGNQIAAHLDYTTKYNADAASFVLAQLRAAGIE